jgi:hypothetical protein
VTAHPAREKVSKCLRISHFQRADHDNVRSIEVDDAASSIMPAANNLGSLERQHPDSIERIRAAAP